MSNEIINRVANSKLVTFDLEDFYPDGKRVLFDIKDWLLEGLVLREKDFREYVKNYNWSQHQNQYVALTCSTDAIVPAWAYMLLVVNLEPFVEKAVIGTLDDLETSIYQDIINKIDVDSFKNKPIIIKGCANKPVPVNAYTMLIKKLKPVAKSLMYGEACSSVPLFKR
ncbi:DUF2480 family protein [Lacinutrix sp.]|uniref:DUF2480 family protein n=1 Tax=Lacinutrix sp. TaxID=1937692 RepID=UPI002608824C|nr:DUF2480 family protein [Lacinutrix sp.]MDG1714494.1 DUF2480 family protein [Lacinutrix sp.]